MATHSSILAQYSMDCRVHGVPKSWTQLSDFHFHFQYIYMEFRKMVMMTLYTRQQERHKEQTFGYERLALKHVYYHM